MGRTRFLISRTFQAILVLVIVTLITFAIFSLWPSNPALLVCGKPCTAENLARAQAYMGLDEPWYVQFWQYLSGIFTGRTFGSGADMIVCNAPCLGYSFRLNAQVSELITSRLPVTVSIAVGAAVLWLVVGVGAGIISALRRGSRTDRFIMAGTVFGLAPPPT